MTIEKDFENLKLSGEAPEWMNLEGYRTLIGGYLLPGETPKGMYLRVSKAAASYYEDSSKYESKFFDIMWKNWLCLASPIASNLGTNRGLPISCNSINLADSVDSIFKKNHELAMLSKNGAGVGIYFGDIRGRGKFINGNGSSEGVIPWIKVMDSTVLAVSQGGVRRSAAACYLPIDHLDVEEFMTMRRPTGDVNRRCMNMNHGVCISDEWMESMMSGDKRKRSLWESLLKERVETGEPYIFFSDNVNKNNPECYKQNKLDVKTSNICCLSGDTLVLTKEGPKRIDSLVENGAEIWDGEVWLKNSSFEKRGEDELIRIYFKDNLHVDSNRNHRWFVKSEKENKFVVTFTKDLNVGDVLETHQQSTIIDSEIVKIENLEGIHPVYCPHLPTTGKFALANGLMTGNTEITLYTDPDHTFVCCLSSLNLVRWDEWKDTDTVNLAVRFLDAVLSEYIQKTENMPGMEASRRSAIKGRAIGIGVLGWHTLLQERMLPFDSFETMALNAEIFRTIKSKAEEETAVMAKELGEPDWCKGFNRRNTHCLAVAPTVSNSTISGGYSAGIEPLVANIFSQKSAKGTFIRKNATLERLLESKGQNTPETWKSINEQSGSVQHLKCLSAQEKEVFLTAREINQHVLVKLAVQRQKWVDQAQSVNLFFASNSSAKYIHEVHLGAWKGGLKTLYYLRSEGVLRGDMASRSEDECKACEG